MSGHSKWSTIKRQKQSRDLERGKLFSKLAKAISIAAKTGGSHDTDANPKLRVAVETAKIANMPKDNIERAIQRGADAGENLEEITYEGFGPGGVAVIVEVATNNRNRTGQEIKNFFERGGGRLAGPNSVSFNFDSKGLLVLKKESGSEDQMLKLIDAGVEDLEETGDAIEVYVSPDKLSLMRDKISQLGFAILSYEFVLKPKNLHLINESSVAKQILTFLEELENHDDVQKVSVNLDIPQVVLDQIKS